MLSRPTVGVASWSFAPLPLAVQLAEIATLEVQAVLLAVELVPEPAALTAVLDEHNFSLLALTLSTTADLALPTLAQTAVADYHALIELAAAVECPRVLCRLPWRSHPLVDGVEEVATLVENLTQLAHLAEQNGVELVVEVVNRYESYLLNTAVEGIHLCEQIGSSALKLMLDTFHMNIEEQDAGAAIRAAGPWLSLLGMADSNRRGIGRGHLKLGVHLWGLQDLPQDVPIVLTCEAMGKRPFSPEPAPNQSLLTDLRQSLSWF